MNGLISFLTLLAWYQNKQPLKAKDVITKITELVLSLENLNKHLERVISNMELSEKELEMLYFTIFKDEYESELISMINEFLRTIRELELIPKNKREKVEKILNDFINNIAMISVYYNKVFGKNDKFASIEDVWKG